MSGDSYDHYAKKNSEGDREGNFPTLHRPSESIRSSATHGKARDLREPDRKARAVDWRAQFEPKGVMSQHLARTRVAELEARYGGPLGQPNQPRSVRGFRPMALTSKAIRASKLTLSIRDFSSLA